MNPLTQISDAIKFFVEAHWTAMGAAYPAFVRPGNRWDKDDRKNNRASADLPAVDLIPVPPSETKPFASSSSGLFVRSWELGVATDGSTPEDALNQIEWELVRVAAKMQAERLGLTDLVTAVAVSSTNQTKQDREANRGKQTWTGAVALTVQFQVKRADLIPAV